MKRIGLLLTFCVRYIYYRGRGKTKQAEHTLYEGLETLGGIYVKLAQFICLRIDLIAPALRVRMLSFYDQVTPEAVDISAILYQELGERVKQLTSVEETPFAAGSFGQVYKGKHTDGTAIIVKVQRGQLRKTLWFDFLVLKLVVRFVVVLYNPKILNLFKLLKEFEDQTYQELDYKNEAKQADFFHSVYERDAFIKVPKTYIDLTTPRLLVQEYMSGTPLTEVIALHWQKGEAAYRNWLAIRGLDLQSFIYNLCYVLAKQGLTLPVFYADPHPGNILLMADGKCGLIDFGIVGESPSNRRTYYQLLRLVTAPARELNMEKLARVLLEWGAKSFIEAVNVVDEQLSIKNKLTSVLITKYQELLERRRDYLEDIEAWKEEDFSLLFLTVIAAGESLNMQLPPGIVSVMRTSAITKGVWDILEPDFHFVRAIYKQVLDEVNSQTLTNTERQHPHPLALEHALEHVFDWISGIAENDFGLYGKIEKELRAAYV